MDFIPNEIILIIFDNILLITDKRQFLKTCSRYNKITRKSFLHFEQNFYTQPFYQITDYCAEKFTLELCNDNYFDMIPNKYINQFNSVIVSALAMHNCISLLDIAKANGCSFRFIFAYATYGGNSEVAKWAHENGYDEDQLRY